MGRSYIQYVLLLLGLSGVAWGQVPLEKMNASSRIAASEILRKPDFTFQTETAPAKVRLATMEALFDHPRLAAAMWRECQFVPGLWAFTLPNQGLMIDDAHGLHGTLEMAYRAPGERVYLIEGRVERWRMGNPFPVGAKMLVIYKYKDGPKGFEAHLQTWTTLDSAVLGAITRPFRKYIQRRQEQFISYIMGNMAKGGEFAESSHDDFYGPIQREGDPIATRQFVEVFRRKP